MRKYIVELTLNGVEKSVTTKGRGGTDALNNVAKILRIKNNDKVTRISIESL